MITKYTFDPKPTSTMVALYPPQYLIDELKSEFSEDILDQGPHVTLAFLGDTSEDEFLKAGKELSDIAKNLTPIEVGIQGPGCFRNPEGDVKLALMNGVDLDLWSLKFRSRLKKKGLLAEEKHGFLPHMTLEYLETKGLPHNWEKPILDVAQTSWTCNSFHLVRGSDTRIPFQVGNQQLDE